MPPVKGSRVLVDVLMARTLLNLLEKFQFPVSPLFPVLASKRSDAHLVARSLSSLLEKFPSMVNTLFLVLTNKRSDANIIE